VKLINVYIVNFLLQCFSMFYCFYICLCISGNLISNLLCLLVPLWVLVDYSLSVCWLLSECLLIIWVFADYSLTVCWLLTSHQISIVNNNLERPLQTMEHHAIVVEVQRDMLFSTSSLFWMMLKRQFTRIRWKHT
jgi:hypothetical protein